MKFPKILVTVFAFICTAYPCMLEAQIRGSGLIVAPTRLVLDSKTRTAELTLTNNGTETNTFRVQTINSKMTETGEREIVTEIGKDNDLFADKLIKFAPRQVRLRPGEQQTIRVMARITGNLHTGEYRTGLNFQWIPDSEISALNKQDAENDKIAVKIQFAFGITIPVIIRHGDLSAIGKIEDMKVKKTDKGRFLETKISRQGNRSLYGDFSVYHVSGDGKESLISSMGGVAIYVPNSHRIFSVALPADLSTGKGKLRVEYRERKENGNKLISEASIPFE